MEENSAGLKLELEGSLHGGTRVHIIFHDLPQVNLGLLKFFLSIIDNICEIPRLLII